MASDAVVVFESLARLELCRIAVEHSKKVLRRRQLVDGDGHDVLGDVFMLVLVEVVADARSVRKQVLEAVGLGKDNAFSAVDTRDP